GLKANTLGANNSAFGGATLTTNTTGNNNAAFGIAALRFLATGSFNIAIGSAAGSSFTAAESNNIDIGNTGSVGESNTIRIGDGSTQTAAFITGISGAASPGGTAVFVDSFGRLGTITSSRRFKTGIADMGGESDLLMKLRPVAFYYKPELDPTHTRQYGLVAEEVAQIAPGLVVFDKEGKPETVRYHFVNAMLLNQVQKQQRQLEAQQQENERQQQQILAMRSQLEVQAAELRDMKAGLAQLLRARQEELASK
ncbi:MAG TPA: tail fiber domain-containing protein, partial [Terriglobales bacterium]|nr:tail fiber domain-containing protein [Terriglobales bacterium]